MTMSQEDNDKALEQLADLVKAEREVERLTKELAKAQDGPCARCRDYEREPADYVEDAIEAEGKVAELTKELAERDASFDLRWKADMRAIARWREESPVERDLLWPDHADKVVWLMGQLEAKDELIRAALTCILNSGKKCSDDAHRKTVDRLRMDVAMQDQVRKAREAEEIDSD